MRVVRAVWAAGAALFLLVSSLPVAAGTAPDDEAIELAGGKLSADAEREGALGAYWDAEAMAFVVVAPASARSSSLNDLVAVRPVKVVTTSVTRADIERAHAMLLAIHATGVLDGESWGVGFDPMNGVIEISGSGDRSLVEPILSELGSRAVFRSEGRAVRLSRLIDTSPFKGGAVVDVPGPGGSCSTGFAVRKTSNNFKYILTAGHCYNLNTSVTNGAGDPIGTVWFRAPFPSRDTEMIGGKIYGGKIYIGDFNGGTMNVLGSGDPVVGITYCVSGSFGYEHCNQTVSHIHHTHCFSDGSGCTEKLIRFSNGLQMVPGDSGGPFYYKGQTTVGVRGTIIGAEPDGWGFAQEWSAINAAFGVVPCTTSPC